MRLRPSGHNFIHKSVTLLYYLYFFIKEGLDFMDEMRGWIIEVERAVQLHEQLKIYSNWSRVGSKTTFQWK